MNRRSFFRRLAHGALLAAATIYAPALLPKRKHNMTLLEWARTIAPEGTQTIVEALTEQTKILRGLVFLEVGEVPRG